MPSQIVFPCPNCGASQSVDDATVTTQCQFCGNSISVPENLRPKTVPPDPAQAAPQGFAFGGATGMAPMGGMARMAGMTGLPSMFQNMDINKLREMAMAARSGNTAEAARLYSETFGVSPDEAMQAAELMASHHHVVLNQMQFGAPGIQMGSNSPVVQIGGVSQQLPPARQGMTYALNSPPVVGASSRGGGRWAACLTFAIVLLIAVGIGGAVIVMAIARAR